MKRWKVRGIGMESGKPDSFVVHAESEEAARESCSELGYVVESIAESGEVAGRGGKPSGLMRFGVFLIVLGAVVVIAGIAQDTTVESGGGRVHNVGRMNDRLVAVIVGGCLVVAGAVFTAAGASRSRRTSGDD